MLAPRVCYMCMLRACCVRAVCLPVLAACRTEVPELLGAGIRLARSQCQSRLVVAGSSPPPTRTSFILDSDSCDPRCESRSDLDHLQAEVPDLDHRRACRLPSAASQSRTMQCLCDWLDQRDAPERQSQRRRAGRPTGRWHSVGRGRLGP